MKTIFTFLLSTVFSLSTFANPTGTTQNNIPPEVKALITELRENLNPGELLQHSREEVIGIIRHIPEMMIVPFFITEEHPVSHLTDDEIFDYTALWSDFYLVCTAYLNSWYFLDEPAKSTTLPSVCENHFRSTGERLNVVADVINYYKTHHPSIRAMAKNLVQSRYWESIIYKKNGLTLLSDFEETTETLIRMDQSLLSGDEAKEWNDTLAKVPSLQNAELYFFRLSDSWGYIAFENGQARLLMLMLALNWNRMMNSP